MLTLEIMRHMWPRASSEKVTAIVETCEEVFAEFGIDDPSVVAQLMSNISHENGAGTIVRERMYVHPERMVEIFGAPKSSADLTMAEAEQLVGKPGEFFERVYNVPHSKKLARDLGNVAPGDGFKYRGGGDLQLTGRDSYTRIGKITGHAELIDSPDMLSDPRVSFRVAVAEFVALKCVAPAKRGQTAVVRRLVNGGNNGLAEVTVWVRKWTGVLPGIDAPAVTPRGADSQNKSLMGSKIMQGAAGTAASLGTAGASKLAEHGNTTTQTVSISDVADKVQQASDAVTTVSIAKDNVSAIVETARPLLGLAPNTWATIAICAIVVGLVCIAFTMWERHKKLRDQGV